MNIEELIHDLRSRINPQYYDQIGTESYERQQCVIALESLLARNDVLRKENKHLRAELAAREWRTIESAPRDTPILVGPTKRMGICVAMHCSRDGWVTETCSEWAAMYAPSHWMPLPPEPKP